jgi:signal transduction histidine kinase
MSARTSHDESAWRAERETLENELAASRQVVSAYESIVCQAPLGVYLVDDDFKIHQVNTLARPVFGDMPALIGSDFGEVIHSLWEEPYATEIVQRFRHTLTTGEPFGTTTRIEQRRDRGITEAYAWGIRRIPLTSSKHAVVCYFRDTSAEARAHELMAAAAAYLPSNDALTADGQGKYRFIATLAQELRSPMAPIRTGLELIRRAGDTPEAVARVRLMMERQVNQMVRLIDDLLDVSSISSGKLRLLRRRVPLATLVDAAVEMRRAAIAAHHLFIDVDLGEGASMLDVDSPRIVQALDSLLQHALHSTSSGGTVRISSSGAREAGAVADWVTLTITSDGSGTTREGLAANFDPFTSDDTGPGSRPGPGTALLLARTLVEMHGGSVEAQSDGPGRRSSFTVRLPRFSHSRVVTRKGSP